MVTDLQIRRLRRLDHQGLTRGQAAAKAGLDDKTAPKYHRLGRLPSEVRMEPTRKLRRARRTCPGPARSRLTTLSAQRGRDGPSERLSSITPFRTPVSRST